MKKYLSLILFTLSFILAACDNRPDYVLSRGKMEDVLYDYHIAQGLLDQQPSKDREKKAQDYINAVFEKHNITEAEFDSSVVYYNRNTKDLYKIYANLKKRYTEENEAVQIINGNNDMMAIYSNGGDTTNIWNADRLILLRPKQLLSHESFTIHADSSFRKNDQFTLQFSTIFMKEQTDMRDLCLYAGISVKTKGGKSISSTRQTSGNGIMQITVKATEQDEIESLTGFFYYYGKKSERNYCFIDNIKLIRMHEKGTEEMEEKKDSVAVEDSIRNDSTKKDSIKKEPLKRLTPDEIRRENQSGNKLKIESAPSVRTPNSIGPRRKNGRQAPQSRQGVQSTTPKR